MNTFMIIALIQESSRYLQEHRTSILYRWWAAILAYILLRMVINYIVRKVKTKITENTGDADKIYAVRIAHFVGNIIFVLLMIFTILIIFQIIWFDVALLIWWISLWLWFALETVMGNMVAWILILTNKKVKIGETVNFLWSIKTMGKIKEIHIRYTIVETIDKRKLIIPNMKLAKTPIQAFKTEPLIRGEIKTVVARKYDPKKIIAIITWIINQQDNVLFKNYSSVVMNWFTKRWIAYTWYFFIDPRGSKWKFTTAGEIRTNLIRTFQKNNIEAAYNRTMINVEEL